MATSEILEWLEFNLQAYHKHRSIMYSVQMCTRVAEIRQEKSPFLTFMSRSSCNPRATGVGCNAACRPLEGSIMSKSPATSSPAFSVVLAGEHNFFPLLPHFPLFSAVHCKGRMFSLRAPCLPNPSSSHFHAKGTGSRGFCSNLVGPLVTTRRCTYTPIWSASKVFHIKPEQKVKHTS